jgi:predicted translin family RNA/ssDNA-binding protein
MPSDFLTVGNPPQSPQGPFPSRLKTRFLDPIINAKQGIITAKETIKTKLKFFKSSTDDFPNLAGKLNNKAREYLEAARFYNLEPNASDLQEKTIQQIHAAGKVTNKYPLNLHANQDYLYPISLLQDRVITRPFFRESERAHDIKLKDEIRRTIKEARTEAELLKQGIRDHLEETIQDGTFVTTYVGNPAELESLMSQYTDKEAKDKFLRENLLEPITDHLFKDVPDSTLVQLWKNAPQASNMGRFRTATNRLLQPLYEEQRDFRLKPELRELIDKYFPFERLKLKPKFLPRGHGLKHSLRLYLNNLKNYEPHLYNFCLNAAQNINAQSRAVSF